MTKRPWSSVTTILAYLVGSSVVSAITQTPASGPFAPVTTPPMSSLSISTAACCALAGAGTATAIAAMPIAAAVENRTCRRFILSSLQCPELSCPFSNAMNAPHRVTAVRVLERGERDANCDQLFGVGHVGSESHDRSKPEKLRISKCFPVCPGKRTLSDTIGMSTLCQKRPNAPQQEALLFDHLVGAGEQCRRHGDPERFGGEQAC